MANTNLIPGQAEGNALGAGTPGGATPSSADPWMKLAQDAYKRSTTYADNNYRKIWEDGLRLFNSQHPRDSKYNSDAYKYRSRIFRPKTRSVIRKHEATAAMALFSNPDVVNLEPINPDDQAQAMSAGITKELLQYRLTNSKKGIPWFITAVGAFQDAMTVGLCISFQYWDYVTEKKKVPTQINFMGQPLTIEIEKDVPIVDKPCCELQSIQRVRFDPAANWFDIVGSSPYIILERPMYLQDVLDRMENGYGKEGKKWKTLGEKTLLQARMQDDDTIQQARDGRRENPETLRSTVTDFDVIQVHLNFIRNEGKTYVFYSLKDLELLTDPVPLEEMFPLGDIPITIGFCILETHQVMPKGLTQLGSQLQQEANEIANQRLDNVKFVLNKRWIVRRGSQVDVEGILRNVPGGVTMATDVEKDVKEVNWTDVTASSFQEQDRLNADFDDLEGGGLNSSSVMTNRRLNETVGGMKMMMQSGNSLTEYTFRVWVETWLEPTLRQLVKLEQKYESDETVLAIAAQKAGAWQHYQQNPDLDRLLDQELTLTVNVGMGATDPEQRFQRLMQATGAYSQISQSAPPDMNLPEIRKELFGLAGFKDNARFFTKVDPRLVQARQMMQNAQSEAQQIIDSHKDRIQRRERALDMRESQLEMQQLEAQHELQGRLQEITMEFELKQREQQFDFMAKSRENAQNLQIDQVKARNDANLEWFKAQTKAAIDKYLAVSKAKAMAEAAKHAPKPASDGASETTH